jgi:hypothetical protein
MKYLKSILETLGVKKLPISSYLNWSDLEFDRIRRQKLAKYKKYGGEEISKKRKEKKNLIRKDLEQLINKETGIYFVPDQIVQMQFFSLEIINIRFKNPILDIFKKYEIDVLSSKTYFSIEDRLNRLHFLRGIDPQLRGTGLAELIYRELINYVGWVTSNADAKPGVKILWSKLAKDPNYYTVVSYFDVLAISKKKGYSQEEIKQIIYRFLEAKVEDVYKYKGKTEIDPDLLEMFPELEEKYCRKRKVIKRYERLVRREVDHLPFINDSLIINNKGTEEYCLIRDVYFIEGNVYYWCIVRDGHLTISPYVENGEIGFNYVHWEEVGGVGKYTILRRRVNIIGIVLDTRNIRLTRRNITAQDLVDGYRLTYIPRRVIYGGKQLHQLVFTRTRVKNAIEVRISYPESPVSVYGKKLQLIKNYDYYNKIFIAR